jgi:hypothetical protein
MNKHLKSSLAVAVLATGMNAFADVGLFEWGINKDGVITGIGDPLPAGSTFDESTGLGTVRLSFTTAGVHSGVLFVDHELSEAANTFFNELGTTSVGAPAAGQSWEIDEPGFSASPGDIFDNFLADTLDNTVGKPDPDDVSMAMGWSLVLAPGETALVEFLISTLPPAAGFYLRQIDPDSQESIYFSSSLTIRGDDNNGVIPEGQTVVAAAALGLLAAGQLWRRRHARA